MNKNNEFQEHIEKRMENIRTGIAFIKTRAADYKIKKVIDTFEKLSMTIEVELADVIVDSSASRDIDRKEIDIIYEWIENAGIQLLIVGELSDITDDKDDLEKFIGDLCEKGMAILIIGEKVMFMDDCE